MGFEVETNGIEEAQDALSDIADNAQELDGENEVGFGELFTDAFMRKYTEFGSIDKFFEESPWAVESEEDFAAIPEADLDDYVDEHTAFPSWEEMLGTAGEQWMVDQLGL